MQPKSFSGIHPLKMRVKRSYIALCLIVAFQLLFLLMLDAVLKLLFKSLELNEPELLQVKRYILIVTAVICGLVDLCFFVKKICFLKKLIHVSPIPCVVENFLLQEYREDTHKRYTIYPIARSQADGKLYVTFGAFCASGYNMITSHTQQGLTAFTIKKDDGSAVEKGDLAQMYLLKSSEQTFHMEADKSGRNRKQKDFRVKMADSSQAREDMILFKGFIHIP